MPKLTIDGVAVEVPLGKRLINALVEDGKTDQLHSCGGNAACTTCRVQFVSGEPTKITQAEKDLVASRGLPAGVRLSCQILVEDDMEVKLISRLPGSGKKDTGKPTAAVIEPSPVWTTK
jgi:ferredoxin